MNERVGFWTSQAKREGFVRTRRRQTEVTSTWWAICEQASQPYITLRTTAWYAHVEIDLLPTTAELSNDGIHALTELWSQHVRPNDPDRRAVADVGSSWLVFERMDYLTAERFAHAAVAFFRHPATSTFLITSGATPVAPADGRIECR